MNKAYGFYLICISVLTVFLAGCMGAKLPDIETTEERKQREEKKEEKKEERYVPELSSEQGSAIMYTAYEEQQNEMYQPDHDSTFLYWLNNKLLLLDYTTKCNIFALNTLYKAGFRCPDENVLTRDLMDESKYNDIFPVIDVSDLSQIKKGDLVVWNGHVILFEKLIKVKSTYYAQAWWAGTRKADNGDNIVNNVIYGKYPLNGYFIIRRPVKN